MPRDMSGFYTKAVFPYPEGETNLLTERLLKQGVDPADTKTWPEDVYSIDRKNFLHKHEWKYALDWESPCGLMFRGHGQAWGDLHVNGEYHCTENENPLFRCPYPERKCEYRLKLPPGINCEFHPATKPYEKNTDVAEIERERLRKTRAVFLEDAAKHPGYVNRCMNIDKDEKVRWRLYGCDRCENTECIARDWAKRDTSKANIFYDLYIERVDETGFVPQVTKTVKKGLKVFEKPHAKTDCELALAIWKADPESPMLPFGMSKLNVVRNVGGFDALDLLNRRTYLHENVTVTMEVRNVYVSKNEQKDILADLQAVQEGATVTHESDEIKAAKQAKSDRRADAMIEKEAKRYVAYKRSGKQWSWMFTGYADDVRDKPEKRKRNEKIRAKIVAKAEEILAKEEQKELKKANKGEQLSMEDLLSGGVE